MEGSMSFVFTADGSTHQAALPAGVSTFGALMQAARHAFSIPPQQALVLSDGHTDITCDQQVQRLPAGQRVLVRLAQADDALVFKERITFNPHPKTLTMAGDYEYFAAQGYHPLAFALAELVDNSLRATKANADCARSITVSLVTDDAGSQGMVCVRDNGSGMTTQELNNWAVMNLSMEDRGLLKPAAPADKAGGRYLSSDISYFGVGSKNAAFFLGKTVKVVTKTHASSYVHELCIQAEVLERRYREGQAVYEEDMLHRQPGDAASLGAFEQRFQQPQQLVEHEVVITSTGEEPGSGGGGGGGSDSFTRVLVYDLKGEVLDQLCDEDRGASILRDLAHLYHYYLHGERGNDGTRRSSGLLPNGERIPDVQVERLLSSGSCCWRKALVQVDDDLESRYLAAQRAKLEFALNVPNHGRVEGVLWYFPFENDQESVPLDPHTMGRMLLMSNRGPDGAHTQHNAAVGTLQALTQQRGGGAAGTQMPGWQSQRPAPGGQDPARASAEPDAAEVEAAGVTALLAACPTFETFWQGRLIPGACVDTLPFIRGVRCKRSAAARDVLPDEVFSRVRGALFLGPGFRVTRNKLTFRDNLSLLLESGVPTDRHLEKRCKEWLARCHKELDRTIKFEQLCSHAVQTKARSQLGADVTVFECICDGLQSISKGDIVRLSTKPAVLGRVEHFSVPRVVATEGCYSGGRVTVCALPCELLGPDNLHTWPLRRLEGKVSEAELAEHVSRELGKLPNSLQFEPMMLCSATVTSLPAGASLPETSICVLNGSKAKIAKALIAGKRQHLEVVQTLYYLGPAASGRRKRTSAAALQRSSQERAGATEDALAASNEMVQPSDDAAGKKGGKRSKRHKKGAAAADKENEAPDEAAGGGKELGEKHVGAALAAETVMEDDAVPEGEVVLTVENRSPVHDAFQFQRINGGLTRAGCYVLQYSLRPELPGGRTLRFSVDLQVTAGAPVAFDIRGEGRAIAMSKAVLLGEALPRLQLVFQDAHGNAVAPGPEGLPRVSLQVLEAGPGGGGAVLQELTTMSEVEAHDGGHVRLANLRVVPTAAPGRVAAAGLQLFKPRQLPSAPGGAGDAGGRHNTRGGGGGGGGTVRCAAPGAASGLPVVRAVDVYLAAHVEGMEQQGFLVRLAPGAPHSVRLLAGHPFAAAAAASDAEGEQGARQLTMTQLAPEQALVPAEVLSGEQLPPFKVQVLDAWGNATCPNDMLPFEVHMQCVAAEPTVSSFTVDERGVAVITGVGVTRVETPAAEADAAGTPAADAAAPQPHGVSIWPHCDACEDPLLLHALQLAEPLAPLGLQLSVLPSEMPAELLMTYKGQELPRRLVRNAEGDDTLVWQLTGIDAGSRVKGLAVRCVDEVGRPAAVGVKGRVQASWAKGSKTGVLSGTDFKLPPLSAPDSVGDPQPFWVRFTGDKDEWPDVSLDIQFEVSVVAGAPVTWGVCIVDRFRTTTAAAAAAGGGDVAQDESLGMIPCGRPFTLEIEAIDAHHNRCTFADVEARPVPVVRVEPVDPEAQLTLEPDSWVQRWDNTQAGGEVCQFKLWLAGPPGPVRIIITDTAGEGGGAMLAPDELTIQLMPGPAAALVADCPQLLECGSRGLLDSLPVKVVDAYGNLIDSGSCSFEVELSGSAFSSDGSMAARVSANGSNRTKLRSGVATFRGVRVAAPAEGEYKLSISSVSRKVAVKEAVVSVKVSQQNLVCNLEVLPACLPADEDGAVAGGSLVLLVALETEDQQPVPWDDLLQSCSLRLTLPLVDEGGAAGGGAGRGKSKAGKGGSARAEVQVLPPECLYEGQQVEGLAAAAAGAAAGAAARGCVVCFRTPELTAAGGYTVAAEYREGRPQLLPGLGKEEVLVRSTSHQLHIAAGPISSAAVQAQGTEQEQFTISNGRDAAARRLLRNAAVQLVDRFGNAAAASEVALRWRLVCADSDGEGGAVAGAEAPRLCCSAAEAVEAQTDERGRAFFGDLAVEEGSGRMGPGSVGQGLQCSLELQVLLPSPKAKSRRSSSSSSTAWRTLWQRPVLFSDDDAGIRGLQVLQEQREQVQQQLAALKESMADVAERVTTAQQEHRAACKAAGDKLGLLKRALKQPQLELPTSSMGAQQLLEQVRQQAADTAHASAELDARYGAPQSAMTQGINRLLQRGDPDVVGVFAQLGHVNEPRLSAVLAANYASSLQTLVVKTYEAISRLRSAAQEARSMIPSMLSYTLIQAFTPEPANCGLNTAMQGVSELAQQLAEDACTGADPALPIILPHTRTLCLAANQGRPVSPSQVRLAADQWPPGFVGFAVNLIRPRLRSCRQGLLYSLVGRTMVFESVDQAAQYREYACALRASVPDIITLCGGKLSGRGVVMGSSFRVVPVAEAAYRFGTIPAGQQAGGEASGSQAEAAAEGLVAALRQQDAAAAELQAAEEAAQQPQHLQLQQQQAELQQQLQQLSQELRQQRRGMEGAGGGKGGRASKHGRDVAAQETGAAAGGPCEGADAADTGDAGREGRQQRSSKRKKA